MKKRNLNIFDAGIAFVMAFILAQFTSIIGTLLAEMIMQAFGISNTKIDAFWNTAGGYLLQAICMNIAFVLLFVYYYKHRNRKQVLQLKKPTNTTWNYVGFCLCIGVATMFLLSGTLNYWQLLIDKLGFKSATLSYEINSVGSYLISLISLAVIPAICEEIIFRGLICSALKEKGHWFAVILSSVMFAIFHFSPSQLLYPICFGIILSIVYLKTNNILFPILLHFINNALTLSIQYFSSSSQAFTHSMGNLVYAIVTCAIWVGIMSWLIKDFKKYTTATQSNIENYNQTNENQLTNNNVIENNNIVTKSTNTSTNNNVDKFNKIVLYGSIVLMIGIYLILLAI